MKSDIKNVPINIFNSTKLKASGAKIGDQIEVNNCFATIVKRTNLGEIPRDTFTLYKMGNTNHFRLTCNAWQYIGYSMYEANRNGTHDTQETVSLHGHGGTPEEVKFLARMFELWHPYMVGDCNHVLHKVTVFSNALCA